MQPTIERLHACRRDAVERMKSIAQTGVDEQRDLTGAEETEFNKLLLEDVDIAAAVDERLGRA